MTGLRTALYSHSDWYKIPVRPIIAWIVGVMGVGCAEKHAAASRTAPSGVNSVVAQRLADATAVFQDITATSDKGIPQELLDRAQCAVIVPALKKGAFVVGGQYGRGFISCRNQNATGWT